MISDRIVFPPPRIAETPLGPIEYAVEGEGPAVLALHGALGGFDQGLVLGRAIGLVGYRTIAVSRPGYLGTPLALGTGPEAQADLYAALLDGLGIADVTVAAVSGGGPSAIHFAVRHRDRCRNAVLISVPGAAIDTPVPLASRIMIHILRWRWFAEMMRRKVEADPERAARRSIPDTDLRRRTFADPETATLFTALMASTFDRAGKRLPGTLADMKRTRTAVYPLESVGVPVLIVHGTEDPILPFVAHARCLADRIADAELMAAKGGGHTGLFTHRAAIRQGIAAFLQAREGTLKPVRSG